MTRFSEFFSRVGSLPLEAMKEAFRMVCSEGASFLDRLEVEQLDAEGVHSVQEFESKKAASSTPMEGLQINAAKARYAAVARASPN